MRLTRSFRELENCSARWPGHHLAGVRLVVLIDRYLPILGGAQIAVHAICSRLVGLGFEVTVLTRLVEKRLTPEQVIDGVRVLRFGGGPGRILSKLQCAARIANYLQKHRTRIDVAMSVPCVYITDLLPLIVSKGNRLPPYVFRSTMMKNFDLLLQWRIGGKDELLKRMLIPPPLGRRILRGAQATIVQSHALAQNAERLSLGTICVVPTGTDLKRFRPSDPDDKAKLRQVLGLSPDDFVIVNVGRYVHEKNQITLLKAVHKLIGEHHGSRLKLFILGATEAGQVTVNRTELEDYVQSCGLSASIRLVDDAANVQDYLRASDLFAFPSVFDEGMPNALVEAMCCGLPVISSHLPQITATLPDGYPYTLQPQDLEAWAVHIRLFQTSPALCREAGASVLEHARANYDIDIIAVRYAELLRLASRKVIPPNAGIEQWE